jgi:hypothetical protein
MATLDDIRKKLQAMESRKGGGNRGSNEPSLTFPFWNTPVGESSILRLLPDKDKTNTFFWRERQILNLEFPGIKGQEEGKRVVAKVPCVEMWGDTCPVLKEVRPWWNDEALKASASKYWKKRSYLFQGFVVEDTTGEKQPENPIRRFIIGPQIFNIIKAALMDPEMENSPVDYVNGLNFTITRTKKGDYSDYSTSKWARRETALSEDQLAAIEKFGLFTLNDWMPAKPDAAALNAIQEMFEASVNGELYDGDRWGTYYRPYGYNGEAPAHDDPDAPTVASPAAKAEVAEPVTTQPTVTPKATTVDEPKKDVNDILAKIRQRANQG